MRPGAAIGGTARGGCTGTPPVTSTGTPESGVCTAGWAWIIAPVAVVICVVGALCSTSLVAGSEADCDAEEGPEIDVDGPEKLEVCAVLEICAGGWPGCEVEFVVADKDVAPEREETDVVALSEGSEPALGTPPL